MKKNEKHRKQKERRKKSKKKQMVKVEELERCANLSDECVSRTLMRLMQMVMVKGGMASLKDAVVVVIAAVVELHEEAEEKARQQLESGVKTHVLRESQLFVFDMEMNYVYEPTRPQRSCSYCAQSLLTLMHHDHEMKRQMMFHYHC